MTMSYSITILQGNLGRDPEVRHMPDGTAVATMSVATSRFWKDKAGERQEATEWHRVVAFGKIAESCGEYLKKGSGALVEGENRTREWEDKKLGGLKRYTTEIVATNMQMLGSRGERPEGGGAAGHDAGHDSGATIPPDDSVTADFGGGPDDDIPF